MNVHINGNETQVAENCNITALLTQLGLRQQRLAVEVNKELVPRSQFGEHELKSGDRVEIVRAIGGG
ncbi:MAG: sulfur carrier protein ThiS [Gammaproteobacteria bacterium]|nr:sulfur carrier protein ThiS [Gammaproteobacteria bacterium]